MAGTVAAGIWRAVSGHRRQSKRGVRISNRLSHSRAPQAAWFDIPLARIQSFGPFLRYDLPVILADRRAGDTRATNGRILYLAQDEMTARAQGPASGPQPRAGDVQSSLSDVLRSGVYPGLGRVYLLRAVDVVAVLQVWYIDGGVPVPSSLPHPGYTRPLYTRPGYAGLPAICRTAWGMPAICRTARGMPAWCTPVC